MGKRLALDEVGDIAGFRLRLFEKSRSYGHIVKEVSDHNTGSVRCADLFEVELDGHVFRKPVQDLIGGTNAGQGISGLGDHLDLGDGRDTGERFSAKAQADKPRQIAVVPDLAGRVALKGLSDLVLFNAAPVVRDAEPVKALATSVKPSLITKRHKKGLRKKTAANTTDSLQYYIARLEKELENVNESTYSTKAEEVLRADARLQKLVQRIMVGELSKDNMPSEALNTNKTTEEQP